MSRRDGAVRFATSTATELLAGLAERRFTARQLLDGLLSHIEAHEPQIHALAHLDAERARAAADAADDRRARGEPLGPLAGLPMTVKDGVDVAGMPTTSVCRGCGATSPSTTPRWCGVSKPPAPS